MLVTPAYSGSEGIRKFESGAFDLVILDVMMPEMNGIEVLKVLREKSHVPVLMLTARGDPVDRIIGLELGADDYVPKPCPPREISARIQAILRRTQNASHQSADISWKDLKLNVARRTCRYGEEEIPLTGTEFSIMLQLVQAKGAPVSKETLYIKALGRVRQSKDRTIDVHMSSIRRKLTQGTNGRLEPKGWECWSTELTKESENVFAATETRAFRQAFPELHLRLHHHGLRGGGGRLLPPTPRGKRNRGA